MHPDGIQQEFALAVDLGVHLTRATYHVEEDSVLVSGRQEATC